MVRSFIFPILFVLLLIPVSSFAKSSCAQYQDGTAHIEGGHTIDFDETSVLYAGYVADINSAQNITRFKLVVERSWSESFTTLHSDEDITAWRTQVLDSLKNCLADSPYKTLMDLELEELVEVAKHKLQK